MSEMQPKVNHNDDAVKLLRELRSQSFLHRDGAAASEISRSSMAYLTLRTGFERDQCCRSVSIHLFRAGIAPKQCSRCEDAPGLNLARWYIELVAQATWHRQNYLEAVSATADHWFWMSRTALLPTSRRRVRCRCEIARTAL
jgi:hypothetical protein